MAHEIVRPNTGNPFTVEALDTPLAKAQFSPNFLWGAATAAYQIEGAAAHDGKGPSIWDRFCATSGNVVNGDSGEVACDHYHRWRDDVALMRQMGLLAYRFSVSWPRVMPQGRGAINERGLDFYDRLVDGLRAANIEPFVTLFHWDLPLSLQDELGGWLSADSPHIFADYAQCVFDRLGDRVRFWMTLNEPWVVVDAGYFHGTHPPGIRDRAQGYRAGHNLLRAHAYAVARYRAGRNAGGKISFALNSAFSFPATERVVDVEAAERAVQNFAGWFGDPPYHGDYPPLLRERLGDMLPAFTAEDSRLLRRSVDYIALNYYTSDVVRHSPGNGPMELEYVAQPDVPKTQMNWPIMPEGFKRLLMWLNSRYPGLPFYITENGAACADEQRVDCMVDDQDRIAYLRDHIAACADAMAVGVDLRGYLVWSLIDNLEWSQGFSKRFGLIHCDRATLSRRMKASGHWYARWIAEHASKR
ncbi:MAG: GH1 family beta-glucosidase [Phycisphaerae bacterium]